MTTKIPVELSSTPGIVDGSNATAITIDSSENVMIGTTSTGLNTSSSEAGHNFFEHGYSVHSRSGQTVMSVNRLSDDGNIMDFRKDGTLVGSIGSEGGDALFIQSGTSSGAGLIFHPSSAFIAPARNGVKIDNTIDLGKSTHRFKDLYLSGGAFIGGTGSANKLDDYEEGTWTPTHGGQNMTGTAVYVKIGRFVHIQGDVTAHSSASSTSLIGGLPFTVASSRHSAWHVGYTSTATGVQGGYINNGSTLMYAISPGTSSTENIAAGERIIFTGSYDTAS